MLSYKPVIDMCINFVLTSVEYFLFNFGWNYIPYTCISMGQRFGRYHIGEGGGDKMVVNVGVHEGIMSVFCFCNFER